MTNNDDRITSSPLAGEEWARREAVGRRGVGRAAADAWAHDLNGGSAADPSPNPLPQGERAKRDLRPLAKRMRREPTDAERKLWSILRAKRLAGWKFKRQEQIDHFIVDFVCFRARLIIEADGSQHAENVTDEARTSYLETQGFRVLRFWNIDILTNPDGVATAVLAALETPLPNPSPARGEGVYGALHG